MLKRKLLSRSGWFSGLSSSAKHKQSICPKHRETTFHLETKVHDRWKVWNDFPMGTKVHEQRMRTTARIKFLGLSSVPRISNYPCPLHYIFLRVFWRYGQDCFVLGLECEVVNFEFMFCSNVFTSGEAPSWYQPADSSSTDSIFFTVQWIKSIISRQVL